jgi:hypothetical protein
MRCRCTRLASKFENCYETKSLLLLLVLVMTLMFLDSNA